MFAREKNKLDKLVREKVRDNFDGKCLVCGKPNSNVHHIEGRRIMSCRWYLPNLIMLCPLHHTFGTFSAHQSPLSFFNYLIDIFGQKYLDDIQKQSNKSFKGTYQQVLDYLEEKKKNYV